MRSSGASPLGYSTRPLSWFQRGMSLGRLSLLVLSATILLLVAAVKWRIARHHRRNQIPLESGKGIALLMSRFPDLDGLDGTMCFSAPLSSLIVRRLTLCHGMTVLQSLIVWLSSLRMAINLALPIPSN